MQVCTSLQTDNHASTPPLKKEVFYWPDALPAAQPTASKHSRQKSVRKTEINGESCNSQQWIDVACQQGAQQQTRRLTLLQRSTDGTDRRTDTRTDTTPLRTPCGAGKFSEKR